MVWFFLCDRTDLLPASEKHYDRDLFLFIFLALTCVAFGASLQPVRTPLLLNRPQTEEWKGWMQVLFLLYHYFEAKEAYNGAPPGWDPYMRVGACNCALHSQRGAARAPADRGGCMQLGGQQPALQQGKHLLSTRFTHTAHTNAHTTHITQLFASSSPATCG